MYTYKEQGMEKNTNEEIEIDLIDLFYLLKSKFLIILLSGIIFAASAGLISSFLITPLYTSKTQLYILNKSTALSLENLQLGSQLTQDYMVLVKSRPVVTKVINDLGLNMTYEQMAGMLKISIPSNTSRILEIQISYQDAYLAKQIVDDFAKVSADQIATIMDTKEPTVVEEGYMQPYPSSPNKKKFVMIGGLVGIFLAGAIIVVLYLMDDTIKDAEDVEKYLGLTTIGLIPIEAGGLKQAEIDKKKRKQRSRLLRKKEKR
jgi:capsular polysaccharide biosynthesis protein